MPSLRASAALLAAASLVVAAPTPIAKRSLFRIDQVQTGKVFKAGPLALARAYGKYNAPLPANIKSAAAAAESGSVSANPGQYDESYLCPVTVGGNTLNLDFDTGSSDLWVFSDLTPSSETTGQDEYQTASGQKLNGYTWKIGYGDGSGAAGVVYADKVTVGEVTATSQAVEAATSVSGQFVNDKSTDGLLGLAFSSINTVQPKKQTTFFDTVKGDLASPVFAADLRHQQAGSYDFGFIDNSKYTGDITWLEVDSSQGFWQFDAGGSIGTAIMDTGTTLLLLPDAVVTQYYQQIPSAKNDQQQGGYVFPCSSSVPDFTIELGGTTFTVPGSFINYAPVDEAGQSCFGGLQSSNGVGINIFGDIFMKNFYVIFDQSQSSPRLGVASQGDGQSTIPSGGNGSGSVPGNGTAPGDGGSGTNPGNGTSPGDGGSGSNPGDGSGGNGGGDDGGDDGWPWGDGSDDGGDDDWW